MTKANHAVTIRSGLKALPKLEFQTKTKASWMFQVNCKVKLVQNRHLGERKRHSAGRKFIPGPWGPSQGTLSSSESQL